MLSKLNKELAQKGIVLSMARVRDSVRELMRRGGLEIELSNSYFYDTIIIGVEDFVQRDKNNGELSN